MWRRGLPIVCLSLALAASGHGQNCVMSSKDDDTINKHLGLPVLKGKPFAVPALTWKFESPTAPETVEARYQWQWIQFPYPEHAFGAWSDAEETVTCSEPGLEMSIPAHTVRPRGWYKGKHTALPGSKPRFYQIELVIVWERDCSQRLMLGPDLLAKFRNHDALLERSCGAPEEIRFVRKKK